MKSEKQKKREELTNIRVKDFDKHYSSGVIIQAESKDGVEHLFLRSDEYVIFTVDYISGNKVKEGDIIWSSSNGDALTDLPQDKSNRRNNEQLYKVIPERCGKVEYTIYARLKDQSLSEAKKIIVSGFISNKEIAITEVQWSIPVSGSGESQTKTKTVIEKGSFTMLDVDLRLEMKLVGLNGYRLMIELWADKKIILARKHNVLVVDGLAVVELGTSRWEYDISKAANHEVFLEVYIASGDNTSKAEKEKNHILDKSNRNPLLLQGSRKRTDPQKVAAANTLTKSTVQHNATNMEEFSSCTFDRVSLRRKNYPEYVLFDKKNNINPSRSSNRIYFFKTIILFDFDKDYIRSEFISKLDSIAEYLTLNPSVNVKIVGHTDIRGSDDYNMTLGNNRAWTVRNYFVSKNIDPNRLYADSKGKRDLLYDGEKMNDFEHEQNRRVIISYELRETITDIVIYNIVSTTDIAPVDFEIEIEGYTNKGCIRVDDPEYAHKPILTINKEDVNIKEVECNQIPFQLFANNVKTSDVLINKIISWGEYYRYAKDQIDQFKKIYNFGLHSCYPFSDVTQPAFEVVVYPDTLITYDFRYKYERITPFTFNPKLDISLVKGGIMMDTVSELLDKRIESLAPYLSFLDENGYAVNILKILKNIVIDFFQERLDQFEYGIHTFQDFLDKDLPQTHKDETVERKRWVSIRVEMYCLTILVVNVLLLLVTKNKNLFSTKTANKIKQYQQVKKEKRKYEAYLDDNFKIEIKQSGIAESSTVGYEQQAQGQADYIYRYKATATPLIGIDKKLVEFGIQEKMKGVYKSDADDEFSGIKESILESTLKNILPIDCSIKLSISGEISFEYEVIYNFSQQTIEFYDIAGKKNIPLNKGNRIGFKGFIGIYLDIKVLNEYEINWIPFIDSVNTKIDEDLKLSSGITPKLEYLTDADGAQLNTILAFTGIQGKYTGILKIDEDDVEKVVDNIKEKQPQKPVNFELMSGKEITLYTLYF